MYKIFNIIETKLIFDLDNNKKISHDIKDIDVPRNLDKEFISFYKMEDEVFSIFGKSITEIKTYNNLTTFYISYDLKYEHFLERIIIAVNCENRNDLTFHETNDSIDFGC